jgi:hypothetical protein
MKNITLSFLFLILNCISWVARSQEKEQISVSLTDPSKPGKLEVSLIHGSITVIGYAGKEVIIDAVSKIAQPHQH